MALRARFLADKSALARFTTPSVAARLRPLLEDGEVATCGVVDLELLYSSRSLSDYEAVLAERRSLDDVPITPEVMEAAIDLQHALARVGAHRVPIPDLVISAAARRHDLVVLHYDRDFGRLAAVGGAEHDWVVPRGSL